MGRPNPGARGVIARRRLQPPTPQVALVVVTAALVLAVLLLAGAAVRPFVVGLILVYLLSPVVDGLAAAGVRRSVAALVALLLAIAAVVALAALTLTPLVDQVRSFVTELPDLLVRTRAWLVDLYTHLDIAPEVRQAIDGALAGTAADVGSLDLPAVVSPVVGGVFGVAGAIAGYLILPAWLFFVLKDRPALTAGALRVMPTGWRADAVAVGAIANWVFGQWIRGQLLLGAVVGGASFVGLEILGMLVDPIFGRYAILLALIAGLLELVPFIGPIISAIPAVLIGATAGPAGLVAALLLYLLIQQVENNVLVPKIQGDAVSLHPGVVMIALVVGAAVAGLLGAILSLPVTAAGRDVHRYLFHRLANPPLDPSAAVARVSPRLVPAVAAAMPDVAPSPTPDVAPSPSPTSAE